MKEALYTGVYHERRLLRELHAQASITEAVYREAAYKGVYYERRL